MNKMIELNDTLENIKPSIANRSQPGSWKEALLSGFPHLCIAAILLVVTFIPYLTEDTSSQKVFEIASLMFAWSVVGVLIIAFIIAWRKGWPRWSASYYFYMFLALTAPLLILFQGQGYMVLYFIYTLILVLWIYAVTQRDVIKGLLFITPVAILSWWLVLEFIPSAIRNPLQVGMPLVTAFVAILIARFGNWRKGIWIIVGSCMLVGLPISYFRTYHHNIPPEHADSATIAMFTGRFALAWFWSSILVIAPLMIWVLWELSKKCGREGKLGYRLAFTGLLLNLISNLASGLWYARFIRNYPQRGIEMLLSILIILGAVIFIIGVVKLLRAARLEGVLMDQKTIALFIFVALGLPLMFMFPMFDSRRYTSTNMPFGLFYENNVPDTLVYGIGVLWLFLGGWLISQLKVVKQSDYVQEETV